MSNKTSNSIQKHYRKERKRIQNIISRYRRQGLDVEYQLPAIPKRITAGSINRLSKITTQTIRRKTYAPDLGTGERIPLLKFLSQGNTISSINGEYNLLQSKATLELNPTNTDMSSPPNISSETSPSVSLNVPTYTAVILSSFEDLISSYPDEVREIVTSWYRSLSASMSPEELADFLQETNDAGLWLTPEQAYNGEKIAENISDMMKLLDLSAGEKNQIMSSMDIQNDFFGELYELE